MVGRGTGQCVLLQAEDGGRLRALLLPAYGRCVVSGEAKLSAAAGHDLPGYAPQQRHCRGHPAKQSRIRQDVMASVLENFLHHAWLLVCLVFLVLAACCLFLLVLLVRKEERKDEDMLDDDEDKADKADKACKNEDEDAEGDVKGEDDEDETPRDDAILLQDLRNSLEATFRQPTRKLRVKNMVIGFDPATVFGKREQFLPALLITVTCQRFYYEIIS